MNWSGKSLDVRQVQTWLNAPESDLCEHVAAQPALAFALLKEDDSFGPVVRAVVCKDCDARHEEDEAAQLRTCQDCHTAVRAEAGLEWRWYDFYAAQGDEALFLCLGCWKAPKHQARRARDREDEAEEFGPSTRDLDEEDDS
jgi:hypothetical protein